MSKAYKVMGLSRDTFYRYKSAVEGGINALLDQSLRRPTLRLHWFIFLKSKWKNLIDYALKAGAFFDKNEDKISDAKERASPRKTPK